MMVLVLTSAGVLLLDLSIPLLVRDILLSVSSLERSFFYSPYLSIAILIGTHCLKAAVTSLKSIQTNRFQVRILGRIREKIAHHLAYTSSKDRQAAGPLVSSLSTDLFCIESFLSATLWESGIQILYFVFSGLILFSIHPQLAIWAFLPIPIAIALNFYFLPKFRRSIQEHHQELKGIGSHFQELIEGYSVITSCQIQNEVLKRFDKKDQEVQKVSELMGKWTAFYSPLYEWIGGCSLALLLLGGEFLIEHRRIELSVLFSFLVFLGYFYRPVFSSSRLFESWQKTGSALERLSIYLTPLSASSPKEEAIQIHPHPIIEVDQVTFRYATHIKPVFERLNFLFEAGKITGIVGNNGAGKSTLLKLCVGLLTPESGRVYYGSSTQIPRNAVAYLPQEPFLFQTSILSNILLTCPSSNEKEVFEMAKILGIHESLLACPQGYQTEVGMRGTEVSGGQRQKVSILRFALRAKTATYCFLDEPTSYIDLETEKALIEVMFSICHGKTTAIVSHRPSTLKLCDRVIIINEGHILPHQEISRPHSSDHSMNRRRFYGQIDNRFFITESV